MKRIDNIYNRLGPFYDRDHFTPNTSAEYAEHRRADQLYKFMNNVKNSKVFDAACGTGTYLILAKNNDAIMTVGSDISKSMIKCSLGKNIPHLIIADYHNLPIKDNVFDYVLCINSIHYSNNPKRVLSELKRISSKDGRILLSYFNAFNFRKANAVIKLFSDTPSSLEHRYFPRQIEDILSSLGLEIIYKCGINLLPFKINSAQHNERILDIFKKMEMIIYTTKLSIFMNETFIVAKNKT